MLRKRTTGPGVTGPLGRSEPPVKEQVAPEWRITPPEGYGFALV